jgi:hypothetical protein
MGDVTENALGSFLRAREKNDFLSRKLKEYLDELEVEKRLWKLNKHNVLFEEKKVTWRLNTEAGEIKKRQGEKRRKKAKMGLESWAKVKKKTGLLNVLLEIGKKANDREHDGMTANKMSMLSRIRTFVDDCKIEGSEADDKRETRKSNSAEDFEEKPQPKKSQSMVDLSKWAGNPDYTASIRRTRLAPGRIAVKEQSMTFVRKMFRDQHLKESRCKRNHEKKNGDGAEEAETTLSLPEIKHQLRDRMETLSQEDLSILAELRRTGALVLPKIDEKGDNGEKDPVKSARKSARRETSGTGVNDSNERRKSKTFVIKLRGEDVNIGLHRRSISLPDIH